MTLYIGLMSGTSADGMDAALIDYDAGVTLKAALCLPYTDDFRQQLRDAAISASADIRYLAQLDRQIAVHSVRAVQTLLQQQQLPASAITAIGSHGHTLRHQPQPQGFSWQIGDPSWIAEHTCITCVADFRRRDIAAGGQGAPLVPAFHRACLPAGSMVLNIGGIANLSILPATGGRLIGFDTGPGNALLDEWCQQVFHRSCDAGGQLAAQGQVLPDQLLQWLDHPYFRQPPPKSTGREMFRLDALGDLTALNPLDVLTTLTELTAVSIRNAVQHYGHRHGELLICGGGIHNHYLLQRLQALLPALRIGSTADYGVAPDWLEAMAFGWLAARTLNQLSGNAPDVTGASGERILGGIYPA
ncbi:anhydro-N-acetylmuramic acid kinase [Venatoribacter cucullus]|uniref:anhydro-N-acetylmuramic acid kinase n=1 Tax=Venatoribacter cucullus TaxID=2661630 RepID=UPI00223FC90B|nr:anhydro-N-acetylmuramic acid kinase [Venatoribacter cucullus]UZK04533.1 anhydro-N-acetylmuramic acid kinase [Venatoribacter cucullus]